MSFVLIVNFSAIKGWHDKSNNTYFLHYFSIREGVLRTYKCQKIDSNQVSNACTSIMCVKDDFYVNSDIGSVCESFERHISQNASLFSSTPLQKWLTFWLICSNWRIFRDILYPFPSLLPYNCSSWVKSPWIWVEIMHLKFAVVVMELYE